MTYTIRLYTGPVQVRYYADRLREANLTVTVEGTEHVIFRVQDPQNGWGAIGAMAKVEDLTRLDIRSTDWTIVRREP